MKNLSKQLRERLESCKDGDPPLPINFFIRINWIPSIRSDEISVERCYSTFGVSVTMDGGFYNADDNVLLNFDEDSGFVMSSANLIYGASCGFRLFDKEGLARRAVLKSKEGGYFESCYFEVWLHFSEDAKEIESLVYGEKIFSGHATRIELQYDEKNRNIAKVWGGHQGIVASDPSKDDPSVVASVAGPVVGPRLVS